LTEQAPSPARYDWRLNALLFGLTLLSVFYVGREMCVGVGAVQEGAAHALSGWPFAVPLMLILLFHEFGHWFAARAHRVPASLPYFLPMPIVLFGTMGAVIAMPERIRSRNALLDIGAAGPLAGMVIAIPTMIIGLSLSEVKPQSVSGYLQEGQSLLYWLLKRCVNGEIPAGHDVFLHPTAFAAWGGFLITMVNLLPWGQLDGGHIAYALWGERHNTIARWVRRFVLVLFGYNLLRFAIPVWRGTSSLDYEGVLSNSAFWLVWLVVMTILGRIGGHEHPPCEPGALSPGRVWIARGSLVLFVLLFMPTPIAMY
jgi:membrane-associated protease RseP (regulator of RpoE activity)